MFVFVGVRGARRPVFLHGQLAGRRECLASSEYVMSLPGPITEFGTSVMCSARRC